MPIVEAVLANRFLTAVYISRDPDLNPHGASERTIRILLDNEGLHAYIYIYPPKDLI